jgi:uncharacterized membrane protein
VSAQAWVLLGSAILPVIAAIAVYWFGFRWARQHDERERERNAGSDER